MAHFLKMNLNNDTSCNTGFRKIKSPFKMYYAPTFSYSVIVSIVGLTSMEFPILLFIVINCLFLLSGFILQFIFLLLVQDSQPS
jgi:hypothetical protein